MDRSSSFIGVASSKNSRLVGFKEEHGTKHGCGAIEAGNDGQGVDGNFQDRLLESIKTELVSIVQAL